MTWYEILGYSLAGWIVSSLAFAYLLGRIIGGQENDGAVRSWTAHPPAPTHGGDVPLVARSRRPRNLSRSG
jgi:hypothetical protein